MRPLKLIAIGVLCAATTSGAFGERPSLVPTINPADESYLVGEARRKDQMARQLDLNHRMIWLSGFGPRWPNPFEPWPRVPGDIWGYPGQRPIEHPIAQESIQTGPNSWLSRSVYAGEAIARTAPALGRPVAARHPASKVELPGPSDREPPPTAIPRRVTSQRPAGPREF